MAVPATPESIVPLPSNNPRLRKLLRETSMGILLKMSGVFYETKSFAYSVSVSKSFYGIAY